MSLNISPISDDSHDGREHGRPVITDLSRNLAGDLAAHEGSEMIVIPEVAAALKTIQLGKSKSICYEILSIPGTFVTPTVTGQHYIDTPHVTVMSSVVSPFHAANRKESPWWIFFSIADKSLLINKKYKTGDGNFCNLCGGHVSCSKYMSSTPIKNHLERYHGKVYDIAVKKWKIGEERPHLNTLSFSKKVSADDARKVMNDAVTRFIVEKNLPFDTVEDDEFRRLIRKTASLGKQCPTEISNKAVKGEIANMRRYCHKELAKILKGKTCHLTSDHWTDKSRRCFEGISVQYITDECVLVSHDLDCSEYLGSTQAHIMFPKFKSKVKEDWKMILNDSEMMYVVPKTSDPFLGQVTTDTEGKMNKLGQLLEPESYAGHGYCTDHSIQLTAQIAFGHKFMKPTVEEDGEEEEPNVLKKLRELCKLFKSNQKNEILLKCQTELDAYSGRIPVTTVSDCKTRWWSTCSMIERALHLRKALEKMEYDGNLRASDDKVDAPSRLLTPKEWTIMEQVKDLLTPFKIAQQTLEGTNYVTSSLVHCTIDMLMNSLAEFDIDDEDETVDEELRASIMDCAQKMGEDLQARWGDPQFPWNNGRVKRGARERQVSFHPNYILAMALDPRFKNLKCVDESQHDSIKNHIVGEMVKARKQKYNLKLTEESSTTATVTQAAAAAAAVPSVPKQRRNMKVDKSKEGIYARYAKIHRATPAQVNAAGVEVEGFNSAEVTLDSRQELERFFSSCGQNMVKEDQPTELEDPLTWWAAKKLVFPNVWTLAKFYLGIPATSANSERCFSFTNRLLCASRTRMNAKVAEDTFFVHRNFELLPQSPTKQPASKRKASCISEETIEID